MAEADDIELSSDLKLLKQNMIATGGFREWSCKKFRDSDPITLLLKFSANGGVSGCGRLGTMHTSWGDVFGNWDSTGVDFKIVYRRESLSFTFKGKWQEEGVSVEIIDSRTGSKFQLFRGSTKEGKIWKPGTLLLKELYKGIKKNEEILQ